eukprot:552944-Alexandrium_andersonii.AAC.1
MHGQRVARAWRRVASALLACHDSALTSRQVLYQCLSMRARRLMLAESMPGRCYPPACQDKPWLPTWRARAQSTLSPPTAWIHAAACPARCA